MVFGMFRTGTRVYDERPPANCRRARAAWDQLSKDGIVVSLHLLDGYWGGFRPNGWIDEIENHWPLDEKDEAMSTPEGKQRIVIDRMWRSPDARRRFEAHSGLTDEKTDEYQVHFIIWAAREHDAPPVKV